MQQTIPIVLHDLLKSLHRNNPNLLFFCVGAKSTKRKKSSKCIKGIIKKEETNVREM